MANPPPSPTSLLNSLSRHQNHLQSQIQSLLDSQSAALLSGLGYNDAPTSSYHSGTHTPTPTTTRSNSLASSKRNQLSPTRSHAFSPTRHAKSKPLSLNGARRGIGQAISSLTALKTQESEILQTELEARTQDILAINKFTTKQDGLRDAIATISSQQSSQRLEEMRSEEQSLNHEIQDLEDKLAQMRARKQYLVREIRGLESSVGAKLSSYTESLRLVEQEAKRWLSRPPVNTLRNNRDAKGKENEETSLWQLPKERRTLGMAREWAMGEEELYKNRLETVETERQALEDGGDLWMEVRKIVGGVEKGLRDTLKAGGSGSKDMEKVLGDMVVAKGAVDRVLRESEKKGWRLLVACVGAEAEALGEGMDVLRGALEAENGDSHSHQYQQPHVRQHKHQNEDRGRDRNREGDLLGEANDLDEFKRSTGEDCVADMTTTHETAQKSEDDDDGPGPDLLISHLEDE